MGPSSEVLNSFRTVKIVKKALSAGADVHTNDRVPTDLGTFRRFDDPLSKRDNELD